jgi:hypothetical protein
MEILYGWSEVDVKLEWILFPVFLVVGDFAHLNLLQSTELNY